MIMVLTKQKKKKDKYIQVSSKRYCCYTIAFNKAITNKKSFQHESPEIKILVLSIMEAFTNSRRHNLSLNKQVRIVDLLLPYTGMDINRSFYNA